MVWLPIVIFVPALAFNQGLYSHLICFFLYFAHTFHSTMHVINNCSWEMQLSSLMNGMINCAAPALKILLNESPFVSTVSGIDIHMITPITCICCIFYTCVGGIKAGMNIKRLQSKGTKRSKNTRWAMLDFQLESIGILELFTLRACNYSQAFQICFSHLHWRRAVTNHVWSDVSGNY